ncbi:hypothetical protein D3C76_359280 [compost metagenome]
MVTMYVCYHFAEINARKLIYKTMNIKKNHFVEYFILKMILKASFTVTIPVWLYVFL